MKLLGFAIFDEKGAVYSTPFFMAHRGLAIRTFNDLVTDANSKISKHPEDYKLYVIGDYDDVSGVLTSLPQPEFLNNGTDFKT